MTRHKNVPLEKKEITTKFSSTPNRETLQPKLQPLTIYHGRNTCLNCFVSSDKRNIKTRNFQKLSRYKEVAEAWEKVHHEYNKINQMVDWQDFAEKWAFKGKFFKKEFLASQMQFVSTNQLLSEKDQQNNESVRETTKDVDTLRKSVWQQYKYKSCWLDDDEKRCIICNKDI